MSTPNLQLNSYNSITDASSVLVYNYVNNVSGSAATQNLGIIDSFVAVITGSLTSASAAVATETQRINNTRSVIIQVVPRLVDVTTISGAFDFICPSDLNSTYLYRSTGFLNAAGEGGDYNFNIYNTTTSASMLNSASPIIIPDGDVIGVEATISTTASSVATDDIISIYTSSSPVDVAGTGLQIILEFMTPQE